MLVDCRRVGDLPSPGSCRTHSGVANLLAERRSRRQQPSISLVSAASAMPHIPAHSASALNWRGIVHVSRRARFRKGGPWSVWRDVTKIILCVVAGCGPFVLVSGSAPVRG